MKNWKNNRGILLNNPTKEVKTNVKVSDIYNYNHLEFLKQEINLKRIIDLEFQDINYVDKVGIKKYYNWKKM